MEKEDIYKEEILGLFNIFEALDKQGVLIREKYPSNFDIFLNSVLEEKEILEIKADLIEIFPDVIFDSSDEISIETGNPFYQEKDRDFVYSDYEINNKSLYNQGYINVRYGRQCGMLFRFYRIDTLDNFVIANFYKWEGNNYDRSPIVDRNNEKYRKLFNHCNNIVIKRIRAYSVSGMT